MNNKLTAALHVTRKSGPWIAAAVMFAIAVNDLKKTS
jgi:hypothetical protein